MRTALRTATENHLCGAETLVQRLEKGNWDTSHRFWQSSYFPLTGLTEQETSSSQCRPTEVPNPTPPPPNYKFLPIEKGMTPISDTKHRSPRWKAGTKQMFWLPLKLPHHLSMQDLNSRSHSPIQSSLPLPNTPLSYRHLKFESPVKITSYPTIPSSLQIRCWQQGHNLHSTFFTWLRYFSKEAPGNPTSKGLYSKLRLTGQWSLRNIGYR